MKACAPLFVCDSNSMNAPEAGDTFVPIISGVSPVLGAHGIKGFTNFGTHGIKSLISFDCAPYQRFPQFWVRSVSEVLPVMGLNLLASGLLLTVYSHMLSLTAEWNCVHGVQVPEPSGFSCALRSQVVRFCEERRINKLSVTGVHAVATN
ncbi:hypothetical protein PoB_003530900 [Plakobranchus ocellatus]|uniref:Uncharacterized protein n=1 Tax=Plakobranchus ocellatus TaxID=259542 RepID=A0AAV4ARN9_9GAST|nr:hypothetical protein PoB_003530900 [Plakobranchus ocellatus]